MRLLLAHLLRSDHQARRQKTLAPALSHSVGEGARRADEGHRVGRPLNALGCRRAFTIVEIMLAMTIFTLVLTAIYSCWTSILKGSKAGLDAAAAVQRARVSVRAVEEAMTTAQMFSANPKLYTFEADTKGNYAELQLVAHLPDTFPGSRMFGEQMVRHVKFRVEPDSGGGNKLMLYQLPLLMKDENVRLEDDRNTYRITLGRDVDKFALEFWDAEKKDWVDEWTYTNKFPPLVRVAIGMGNAKDVPLPDRELVTRIVSIPSVIVPIDWQRPLATPGRPGLPPGMNNLPPGVNPNPGLNPGLNRPGAFGNPAGAGMMPGQNFGPGGVRAF